MSGYKGMMDNDRVHLGKVNRVWKAGYIGYFVPENFIEEMLKATKQYPALLHEK